MTLLFPAPDLTPRTNLFPGEGSIGGGALDPTSSPTNAPGLFPGLDVFPSTGRFFSLNYSFQFSPPTEDVRFALVPGRGLIGLATIGLTVWRTSDGVWHTGKYLADEALTGADRLYRGGYVYTLDDSERAELIAAGFGDRITLTEV